MSAPIRVLIANGSPVVLEGLRRVSKRSPDMRVVGEATDGVETIEKAAHLKPDVVLLELKLPQLDGLAVLRSLQTCSPQSRAILFASEEDKDTFVEAMKLGCSGILFEHASPALIEKSIQKIHAGELWLDSSTTTAIVREFASQAESAPARRNKSGECAQLTRREHEIVLWLAYGYKNKKIAERMFLAEQTVKNHLHSIFHKLGISDRLELALYAVYNRLHLEAEPSGRND